MSKSPFNSNQKESKDSSNGVKQELLSFKGPYENYNPRFTRVDNDHFQAQVPSLLGKRSKAYSKYKKQRQIRELFDPEKVDGKKLEEYLQFVKSLAPENSASTSGMLMAFDDRMEEKALEFLHSQDYSFTRAKFYLLFPTLLKWNEYSADTPLEISEKEMEEKIAFFIAQMLETKSSQQEKWRNELQDLVANRVPLSKLMSSLEQGKLLGFKNEIPDFLKEMLSKTALFSKEIKHKLHLKLKLEILEDLKKQSEDYKIITKEMDELDDCIERSKRWIENVQKLGDGPYTIKELEIITNEYKNVPLNHEAFQKFKKILDGVKDLMDKLPTFIKNNKTRYTSGQDRIPLKTAIEFAERIVNYNVECEEFNTFLRVLETSRATIENVKLLLEDERTPKTLQSVSLISKELNTLGFTDPIQNTMQRYVEYFTIVERMNRNLPLRNKLSEIDDDLKVCRNKGFMTEEVTAIKQKVNKLKELYSKSEEFFKFKKSFNVKQLCQNYKSVTNNMFEEGSLLECIKTGEEYQIDQNVLESLKKIRNQIQAWKAKIKDLKSDFTFDELVKSLQEGFSLGFKHPELQGLFDRGKKILIWTIQVINLIKKYDNDFKSKILNETYSNDLSLIISKNLIIFEDDSNQLSFLLDDFPSEVCIGPEFSKLDELKKQADDWSRRVKEELQKKKDFDPLVIQGLLEESVRFPSELGLKNQLKEINNFVLWISKAREVLADQGENYYLVEKFEEKGVASLIENLGNIEDFYETDVIKLLVENRKTIGELLKIISNPATKIKARSFDMNYIKKLIDESQQIKFPEDEENLVQELEELITQGYSWISNNQKVRGVERKKKTGRGRGRRGRAKKEAPEIKVKTEMSESGNMEIESEKPVNLEEAEQEKSEAGKGESSKQEIKTEFSPIITRHRSELQGTDNKTETIQIEDEEKKEEPSEHHLQLEKNKLGTLFLKDSDNFYFFFKLPLLLKIFYEGLKVRAPVEDLRTLQQYLFEIYSFIESTNSTLSRKISLDDLEQIITTGNKLKLYLLEIEKCQKLYKWGSSWLGLAVDILSTIPDTKQTFKKPAQDLGGEQGSRIQTDLSDYHITYDEHNFRFILHKPDQRLGDIDDESQAQEQESSVKAETPQKRISKREKKINRKFQESGYAVFSPELEEKPLKKVSPAGLLGKRPRGGGARKGSVHLSTEKRKKITPKELPVQSEKALKEENPNEQYCICRKGHDGLVYMIACDRCGEWFHGDCIGLSKSAQLKNIDFNCFACVARHNIDPLVELPDFVWNRINQVELQDFLNLVNEGRMLPLNIPEIDEIIEIEQQIKSFIHRAGLEVQKGAQIDHLQNLLELATMDKVLKDFEKAQTDREKYIKTLYLESLKYPVKLKLSGELIGILQKRDLASEIIKLLNGKQNTKAMKRILSKDFSYINMENDQELKNLYEKLKGKYEISSKIVERFNQIIQQKGEPEEFGQYLQFVEENGISIDKFEGYKQVYDNFKTWEGNARYAIQNKVDKDTMASLQRDYINVAFKSNLIGVLNDIINDAEEWQKKALRFLSEGLVSGIDEEELLEEGRRLRCKTPFVDYLENRRQQQQQWLVSSSYLPQNPYQGHHGSDF